MLVVKIYPAECFLYLRYKNDDAGPVQTVSVFVWSYHPTVQVLQPAFAAMHSLCGPCIAAIAGD